MILLEKNMPDVHMKSMDIIVEDSDVAYEEDIIRNPYSVRCWQRYIAHKRNAPAHQINLVYERALKELPGSYKLWYNYLKLRRQQMRTRCITDPGYEDVNNAFERALVFMHKMPRIWIDYITWMSHQCLVTRTRKVIDRALSALPITQHNRVWPFYLQLVRTHEIPETALRVYRRYMKLAPDNAEEFIDYLLSIDRLDEAATLLARCVNDDKFVSKQGKTSHQLWHELCDLIAKNPLRVTSLKVEPIIKQGLRRFSDQVGKLWCALADYYNRAGNFTKARDIYEEAIQTVVTVRDFEQVYNAYAQGEEAIVSAMLEAAEEPTTSGDSSELDMQFARLEHLLDRRPLLLNSVLLRQNPHNVFEWQKRAKLYADKQLIRKVVDTYTEAVKTVDPKLQTGKLSALWINFGKFYEEHEQLSDAREVFERALKEKFRNVDELAAIWCEYAEMELRHESFKNAMDLLRRATKQPMQKTDYFDDTETVQARVYKSLKVWAMRADLEETFGTFDSCRAVYDKMIDLRIATPQIIMNYGLFLEEHSHFEEAFKAYEKGISLFRWPNVYDLWNTYLSKFLARYSKKNFEGQKLERARDLFYQCLEHCPKEFAKNFCFMWADMEEKYGQPKRAMEIYERAATKLVEKNEKYDVYNVYIKKAAELYGVTQTRPIYERAIEDLPDDHARAMCLRFAALEQRLGEIDRGRAIFAHAAELCDPRVHEHFWETWKDFEIKHGNEDTIREMLRVKRSVQAIYNTQVNFMSAQMLAAAGQQKAPDLSGADSMALLEAKAAQIQAAEARPAPSGGAISFVRGDMQAGSKPSMEGAAGKQVVKSANPAEIDLDDDSDEDADEDMEVTEVEKIEKRAIPTEIYGGLATEVEDKEKEGAEDDDDN